jgi:transposase
MPVETSSANEYETVVVGAGYLVKGILQRLGVAQAIDRALSHQPEIEATYGTLAQVIIVNRLSFQPQPLYQLADWAAHHGMDRIFDLNPTWLDDDRLGAMLEALAEQQVSIWSALINQAVQRFGVDLEYLHEDTTSIYFQGAYEDAEGHPKGGGAGVPLLVEGYNKDGQRHKVQMVLSLMTSGRLPVWYRPWDGNQTDDPVYVADLVDLRRRVLAPENAVLIGDRKLCSEATLRSFCQRGQQFIAPHPWTKRAKETWLDTCRQLEAGQLKWQEADYVSRNHARKAPEQRPKYLTCEVGEEVLAPESGQSYPLRWVFSWSSAKGEQDARQRDRALAAGERELKRIAGLIGKYNYTTPKAILARIEGCLGKAKASRYFTYQLVGTEEGHPEALWWEQREETIAEAERFDGIVLLCANVPKERLTAGEVVAKYKEQVGVEQTIDFIKSPVQIRPMWLHSPKRLMGLTLLIMIAVLVAGLLEQQVRRWIARTGELVRGLMPEKRANPHPTAKALLRAFDDYALVLVRGGPGQEAAHYTKLRPVQQQVWDIMGLPALPSQPS